MAMAGLSKDKEQKSPYSDINALKSNNGGTPKSINTVINPSKISAQKNV